jgi:hypothetical protein
VSSAWPYTSSGLARVFAGEAAADYFEVRPGEPVDRHEVDATPVETTQIAPTILQLLGLDPDALKAVRIEHTRALPVA